MHSENSVKIEERMFVAKTGLDVKSGASAKQFSTADVRVFVMLFEEIL
jgi:hypothetical protein